MLKSLHFQKCVFERLGEETYQANCTDLLGKKKKGRRKKEEKNEGSPKENSGRASNWYHRNILLQKTGLRAECCSPDARLTEGQHQHMDLNSFVLAESRAAGCCGKAVLWDGHVGIGRMPAEKLGIREEISHHLWKVHRMPL